MVPLSKRPLCAEWMIRQECLVCFSIQMLGIYFKKPACKVSSTWQKWPLIRMRKRGHSESTCELQCNIPTSNIAMTRLLAISCDVVMATRLYDLEVPEIPELRRN